MIIREFVAVLALLSSVSTAYILDGKEIPGDAGRRAEEKDANAPTSIQTRDRELWPANPNPNCNTFIDFDQVAAPCVFVNTVPLSNEFASDGVIFSGPSDSTGGAVLNQCGNFGVTGQSEPNFLAFNDNTYGLDPETLTFLTPVDYIEVFVGHGTSGTATISCSLMGTPVGSASVTTGPTLSSLVFQGAIFDSCEISATNFAWVLDDLCFNKICTGGISSIEGTNEFAVADPGLHFHSNDGGEFGNPPDVLEIGEFFSEEVRGLAEADITGQPKNVGLATVACSVRQRAGLFSGANDFIDNDFNIDVFTYDGNNAENLGDFNIATLAMVGSFNTAGLNPGDQVSFDVTASYAALAGTDSLGIRMQATESTNGGAITLHKCELLLSCKQACCPKYITDSIEGNEAVYFPANGCEGFVACFNTQYPQLLNFGYQACPTPPQLLWDGEKCDAPGAAPDTCSDPDEYCVIDNWTPPMPMMSCCSDDTFVGKKAITDCLGFVDCDQGRECAVILCPEGQQWDWDTSAWVTVQLLFDVNTQECNYPDQVTCDDTCMPAGNSDRRVLSLEEIGWEEHGHKLRGNAGH